MYINRRVHGPWCRVRSFKTRCPKCNAEVFYWECEHGCRVFFDLPLRRPLRRHRCNKGAYSDARIKINEDLDEGYVFRDFYNCPVCNRLFKSEKDLKNHLKSMKSNDDEHKMYYRNML
ncbi:MAG: C2H2-type zinc finger protein [Candidatus Helarchaeota archaeon]